MRKAITILMVLMISVACYGKPLQKMEVQFVDEFFRPVDMGTSVSIYIYQNGTTTEQSSNFDLGGDSAGHR